MTLRSMHFKWLFLLFLVNVGSTSSAHDQDDKDVSGDVAEIDDGSGEYSPTNLSSDIGTEEEDVAELESMEDTESASSAESEGSTDDDDALNVRIEVNLQDNIADDKGEQTSVDNQRQNSEQKVAEDSKKLSSNPTKTSIKSKKIRNNNFHSKARAILQKLVQTIENKTRIKVANSALNTPLQTALAANTSDSTKDNANAAQIVSDLIASTNQRTPNSAVNAKETNKDLSNTKEVSKTPTIAEPAKQGNISFEFSDDIMTLNIKPQSDVQNINPSVNAASANTNRISAHTAYLNTYGSGAGPVSTVTDVGKNADDSGKTNALPFSEISIKVPAASNISMDRTFQISIKDGNQSEESSGDSKDDSVKNEFTLNSKAINNVKATNNQTDENENTENLPVTPSVQTKDKGSYSNNSVGDIIQEDSVKNEFTAKVNDVKSRSKQIHETVNSIAKGENFEIKQSEKEKSHEIETSADGQNNDKSTASPNIVKNTVNGSSVGSYGNSFSENTNKYTASQKIVANDKEEHSAATSFNNKEPEKAKIDSSSLQDSKDATINNIPNLSAGTKNEKNEPLNLQPTSKEKNQNKEEVDKKEEEMDENHDKQSRESDMTINNSSLVLINVSPKSESGSDTEASGFGIDESKSETMKEKEEDENSTAFPGNVDEKVLENKSTATQNIISKVPTKAKSTASQNILENNKQETGDKEIKPKFVFIHASSGSGFDIKTHQTNTDEKTERNNNVSPYDDETSGEGEDDENDEELDDEVEDGNPNINRNIASSLSPETLTVTFQESTGILGNSKQTKSEKDAAAGNQQPQVSESNNDNKDTGNVIIHHPHGPKLFNDALFEQAAKDASDRQDPEQETDEGSTDDGEEFEDEEDTTMKNTETSQDYDNADEEGEEESDDDTTYVVLKNKKKFSTHTNSLDKYLLSRLQESRTLSDRQKRSVNNKLPVDVMAKTNVVRRNEQSLDYHSKASDISAEKNNWLTARSLPAPLIKDSSIDKPHTKRNTKVIATGSTWQLYKKSMVRKNSNYFSSLLSRRKTKSKASHRLTNKSTKLRHKRKKTHRKHRKHRKHVNKYRTYFKHSKHKHDVSGKKRLFIPFDPTDSSNQIDFDQLYSKGALSNFRSEPQFGNDNDNWSFPEIEDAQGALGNSNTAILSNVNGQEHVEIAYNSPMSNLDNILGLVDDTTGHQRDDLSAFGAFAKDETSVNEFTDNIGSEEFQGFNGFSNSVSNEHVGLPTTAKALKPSIERELYKGDKMIVNSGIKGYDAMDSEYKGDNEMSEYYSDYKALNGEYKGDSTVINALKGGNMALSESQDENSEGLKSLEEKKKLFKSDINQRIAAANKKEDAEFKQEYMDAEKKMEQLDDARAISEKESHQDEEHHSALHEKGSMRNPAKKEERDQSTKSKAFNHKDTKIKTDEIKPSVKGIKKYSTKEDVKVDRDNQEQKVNDDDMFITK